MPRVVIFPEARAFVLGNRVLCWSEQTELRFYDAFHQRIRDFILSSGSHISYHPLRNLANNSFDNFVLMSTEHVACVMVYMTCKHNFIKRLCAVQRRFREKRNAARNLAFMMGLHQRLGANSALLNIDDGVLRMCCM